VEGHSQKNLRRKTCTSPNFQIRSGATDQQGVRSSRAVVDSRTSGRSLERPAAVAPERIRKWGHRPGAKVGSTDRARSAGKCFLVVPLHFSALKAQLVVLVSAFVMVSTDWSVFCLLCSHSRCPRAQPFVKVGARAPVPHGVGATDRQYGASHNGQLRTHWFGGKSL